MKSSNKCFLLERACRWLCYSLRAARTRRGIGEGNPRLVTLFLIACILLIEPTTGIRLWVLTQLSTLRRRSKEDERVVCGSLWKPLTVGSLHLFCPSRVYVQAPDLLLERSIARLLFFLSLSLVSEKTTRQSARSVLCG